MIRAILAWLRALTASATPESTGTEWLLTRRDRRRLETLEWTRHSSRRAQWRYAHRGER